MNRYILLFILLWSLDTMSTSAGQGIVVGDVEGITIGDYNLFPQDKDIYGIKRYGGGLSHLRIGERYGFHLSNQTGIFLGDYEYIFISVEPVNGNIRYDKTLESFYMWNPMIGSGVQFSYGDYKLSLIKRFGYSINNLGKKGLDSKGDFAGGYSVYFNNGGSGLGYSYTSTNDKLVIENLDLHFKYFGIRYERIKGINEEKTLLILIRFQEL